ncbi:MAG: TolC family protein, partial [Alphaproteobacteria bacterium]|nr:TolC family protein [Alphaproteobacteria bacterium]
MVDAHPQIQAARNQHASAGEAVGSAYSAYWPTLALTGNTGTDYVDSPDRRASALDPYQHGRNQVTLSLTQRLFDGFAREAGVDAAQEGEQAAAANVDATVQTVLIEALTAYVDVLRQTHLLALGRDNERNVRTQLQLEDERVKRGSGMAVDVLQAKHRLQVAKERRVAIEGALRNAISRYVQVFGHAPTIEQMDEPVPQPGVMPASLDAALQAARRDNPTLLSGARQIEAAAARTQVAEGAYWPSFDLVGRGNWEKDRDATIGIRRDWSALLRMNWELFSGFRTDALVAQSTFDRAALIDNQDYAVRKTEEATRLAWTTLQVARERLDVLESAVNLALEVWDMRKKLREAGKATVLDVLDAESDTVTARMSQIIAHFDERVAAFQLLQAMGRLRGAEPLGRIASSPARAPA